MGDSGLDSICNCTTEERSSSRSARFQPLIWKSPLRADPAGKVEAPGFACMKRRVASVVELTGKVDVDGLVVRARDHFGGRELDN